MSTINLIIEERARNIGNFIVGRLLPFREKRMIGPFIYIDHMGPVLMSPTENMDIAPHPHIGLSTLTYLLEGSVMHRDSIGTQQEIKPGEVNWMTAGKGIVHSERTPDHLRDFSKTMHGLQLWVALPKELEEIEPSFYHIKEADLPQWKENNVDFKLIAGKIKGHESPVPVHSPLYFLEIKSTERTMFSLGEDLYGEAGIYILEGGIIADGESFGPKQLLVSLNSSLCQFQIEPFSKIYIFGGEPFPEERIIYWNFVATNNERIEAAKERWKNQKFDKIEGETEFVPLPE